MACNNCHAWFAKDTGIPALVDVISIDDDGTVFAIYSSGCPYCGQPIVYETDHDSFVRWLTEPCAAACEPPSWGMEPERKGRFERGLAGDDVLVRKTAIVLKRALKRRRIEDGDIEEEVCHQCIALQQLSKSDSLLTHGHRRTTQAKCLITPPRVRLYACVRHQKHVELESL